MKYWRKMLLAVFALCLFAGMAFAAPAVKTSICDPECKDGLLFVGDMFYDGWWCCGGWDPVQDCPCENLNWPLDGAIWGCDFGFLNTGSFKVPAMQWDLFGLIPHKTVWSEKNKIMFVSYLNPECWLGSPKIAVVDLDDEQLFNIAPYDFDSIFQINMNVGALALDDERDLLYVTNMDPDDATVKVLNVSDPKNPFEPIPDPEIDLCACCDCEANYRNMDIVYYKDRLYVSYFDTTYENGLGYGDPMIAVFDAKPHRDDGLPNPSYGKLIKCVDVICGCMCPDIDDSYFLASNLAVSEVDGHVIVLSTYHPFYIGPVAALHALGIIELENEDYVNAPMGVIAATDMETGATVCQDVNSSAFQQIMKTTGGMDEICCTERYVLRAIDVSRCICEDCEQLTIYVTAMKYAYGVDCSYKFPLCCDCLFPFNYEFNWEAVACPLQGYVFALTLNGFECENPSNFDFAGFKELPDTKWFWNHCDKEWVECDWTWIPGDIVATSWVKENKVRVHAPVVDDGLVTIKTTYQNIEETLCDGDLLGMSFKWDPEVLQFADHKIMIEGEAGFTKTLPSDLTAGDYSWNDILQGFQGCLLPGKTLTLEMTFTPIKTEESTHCIAVVEGYGTGYECFSVTVASGGEECPTCCCGELLDETTVPPAPAVGEDYEGDAWIFKVECQGDTPAEFVTLTFAESKGGDYKLVRWDGSKWEEVDDETIVWSMDDTVMTITVASDFGCDPGIYAVVAADADLGELNSEGGGGGGSEEPVTSSSGCNVGFSMAALLFAVPLVSIFRKR